MKCAAMHYHYVSANFSSLVERARQGEEGGSGVSEQEQETRFPAGARTGRVDRVSISFSGSLLSFSGKL